MVGALESGLIVALLVACLIALILVSVARREARAVREQANEDAREQRSHLKDRARELDLRLEAVHAAERDLASERRGVRKQRQQLQSRDEGITTREAALVTSRAEADAAVQDRLESLAGISSEQARSQLHEKLVVEVSRRAATAVREIEDRARKDAEMRARAILAGALQRSAAETASAIAVSTVTLPNDEMRGRIIGKEGRNINTFEALTGVDLVLDDSSRTVLVSSFDPERRELAVLALEQLVADGRINPQRIEEVYESVREGADDRALAAGRDAALDADVAGLPHPLALALGRLRLRMSHGQNVLVHSIETARIAGLVAAEVGADPVLARRAGLLHDIGKGSSEAGTHALVGAALLARHGEDPAVVNAVAAHHDEVPQETVEAVLVQVADACSASRPGARPLEAAHFVQRMEQIEAIVLAHPGVRKVLAMSAGREVRVIVDPTAVGDVTIGALAREVAAQLTREVEQLGTVRVTVVRESRAVATASEEQSAEPAALE